ncbi:MAG TPA: acyltransferase [Candidatus Limnocylindrales bacterium]|nr:acyltransferase [Candidatus Limnocylindrales bacterium]
MRLLVLSNSPMGRAARKVARVARALENLFQANMLPRMGLTKSVRMGRDSHADIYSRLSCDPFGTIQLGNHVALSRVHIKVGRKATLQAGDFCTLQDATIMVGDNSTVTLGEGVQLRGVSIQVSQAGVLDIAAGGVFVCEPNHPFSVIINKGSAVFGPRVHVSGDIFVRFGGRLKVGQYTGIGMGALLRCEEAITIGDYCLISYDVVVYDTNAHSVDWKERRHRMEVGYPVGMEEVARPLTKPIEIGNDVWIGMRSLILKGAKIGDRVIVGMGTTVTGSVPEDSLVVSEYPRIISRK